MRMNLVLMATVSMLTVGFVGAQALASGGQSSGGADQASATVQTASSQPGPAMFARLQQDDVKQRARHIAKVSAASRSTRRPDLPTMVASASYSSGRDGMLISNDMEQWDQKRFELDLINEAKSGWSSISDDHRDYRSTGTTSHRRSTAPSRSITSDRSDGALAASATNDESSGSLLASVPPWMKYSIVAAPALLGLLAFGAYMLIRWRVQSQHGHRSRESALLMGLVDAHEPVRPGNLARIGRQHPAETAPPSTLETEDQQRRAA